MNAERQPYESSDGIRMWILDGQLHRADGPAVERPDGGREWLLHGELHRDDGPAIVRPTGTTEWYVNGRLHRVDGPAIEYADGGWAFYYDGIGLTGADHAQLTSVDDEQVRTIALHLYANSPRRWSDDGQTRHRVISMSDAIATARRLT